MAHRQHDGEGSAQEHGAAGRRGGERAWRWILRDRAYAAAALLGIGLMAGVDEIVFHQILGWHHLYDRATPEIGLVSDGLLHAAEIVALAAGGFVLADAHRRGVLGSGVAPAGVVTGMGAFQLFDGIVDHKVLRIHQIRYDVDLLPYDLAWNGAAVALLVAGIALTVRAARRPARGDEAVEAAT